MQKEAFYRLIENPSALNDDTVEGLKLLITEYPFFSAAWMLYLKNLKITKSQEFDEALQKAAVRVPDRKHLHHYLKDDFQCQKNTDPQPEIVSPDYNLGEGEESQIRENSLIDKFLSSEKGPVRLKKSEKQEESEKSSEYEHIEKSISESDELITETLAMLYFEQKKYDKALNAFQKLSLKYPEKSVYFASRIAEIEKLKNI